MAFPRHTFLSGRECGDSDPMQPLALLDAARGRLASLLGLERCDTWHAASLEQRICGQHDAPLSKLSQGFNPAREERDLTARTSPLHGWGARTAPGVGSEPSASARWYQPQLGAKEAADAESMTLGSTLASADLSLTFGPVRQDSASLLLRAVRPAAASSRQPHPLSQHRGSPYWRTPSAHGTGESQRSGMAPPPLLCQRRTFVQLMTSLEAADNSGARRLQCIKVLKGTRYNAAGLGDIIIASVKDAVPRGKVKKGDVVTCVVVRTAVPTARVDGSFVRFDAPAAVVISKAGEPAGTRIFGPVPHELRSRKLAKILTLAQHIT